MFFAHSIAQKNGNGDIQQRRHGQVHRSGRAPTRVLAEPVLSSTGPAFWNRYVPAARAEHDDRSDAWVDENKLPSGGGPGEVRLSQNVY
jgi:hypothetical protein